MDKLLGGALWDLCLIGLGYGCNVNCINLCLIGVGYGCNVKKYVHSFLNLFFECAREVPRSARVLWPTYKYSWGTQNVFDCRDVTCVWGNNSMSQHSHMWGGDENVDLGDEEL